MAGWISPEQCTTNCCGPPTPCDPPVATCRLFVDGYGGGSAFLAYTVSNAVTAFVREQCGGVITDTAITLTGGAASGNFTPVDDPDCTYTVIAVNTCATVSAGCSCDTPWCSLIAERIVNSGTGEFESVRIRWAYRSLDPSTPILGHPIVTATLNGVDVFGEPYYDTGDVFVLEPVDLDADYELVVTNECGREVTCTFPIPCCWRQSLLRVTISGLADVTSSCNDSTITFVPRITGGSARYYYAEHEFSATGMAALNQTVLFNLNKFTCDIDGDPELLGTVTVYERNLVRYEYPSGGTVYEFEFERSYDLELYLFSASLSYRVANGEVTITDRYDEFPGLNRSGQFCIAGGSPPCSAFLGGRLETMSIESGGPICGSINNLDWNTIHWNGVEPMLNATEAAQYNPPVVDSRVECYGTTPKTTTVANAVELEFQV